MVEKEIEELFTRVFPNEKTRTNYISRLNGMLRTIEATAVMDVVKAPDAWYPKIQAGYPSFTTRKNILTAILVLFREHPDLVKEVDLRAKWKKWHEDLSRHEDARVRRSEPADKQIAQYTSFEEIEAKYAELRDAGPHKTRPDSLQYILLSIIVHLRPKRADLGNVKIFKKDPNLTDTNYIVLRAAKEGSSFLSMNIYKTSKHYKKVEEELPEGLVRDLRVSVKRWPREYIFVKDAEKPGGGKEPMNNATYSAFVQRTFETLFGRSTGVSMLRHIYISEKLNFDNMTLEEQEEEARLMLHTSGLQRQYKWPKKVICPKLCGDFMAAHKGDGRTRRTRKSSKGHGTPTVGTRRRARQVSHPPSSAGPL